MLDLFPFLRSTLRSNSFFEEDYEGFLDSNERLKVFRESEAPSTESPYITIERVQSSEDQRNAWTSPTFLFHVTGKDTQWRELWTIAEQIKEIFKGMNTLETIDLGLTADESDDTFEVANHGMQNGMPVEFSSTGTLPTGISAATQYLVTNARRNSFQVTLNGSLVNFTTNGTGALTGSFGPIVYQLLGSPTFDDGKNPITDEVTVSVGLQFGFDC